MKVVVLVIPPAGGADLFYDRRKQIVEVLECYFSASVLAPDAIKLSSVAAPEVKTAKYHEPKAPGSVYSGTCSIVSK